MVYCILFKARLVQFSLFSELSATLHSKPNYWHFFLRQRNVVFRWEQVHVYTARHRYHFLFKIVCKKRPFPNTMSCYLRECRKNLWLRRRPSVWQTLVFPHLAWVLFFWCHITLFLYRVIQGMLSGLILHIPIANIHESVTVMIKLSCLPIFINLLVFVK